MRLLLRPVSAASQASYLREAGWTRRARRARTGTRSGDSVAAIGPPRIGGLGCWLELDAQELRGRLAEDRSPLLVAEARRLEGVVDRLVLPGDRMVGPDHEPVRPDLRRQVSKRLGGEDERVVVHRPPVPRGLLLQLDAG